MSPHALKLYFCAVLFALSVSPVSWAEDSIIGSEAGQAVVDFESRDISIPDRDPASAVEQENQVGYYRFGHRSENIFQMIHVRYTVMSRAGAFMN